MHRIEKRDRQAGMKMAMFYRRRSNLKTFAPSGKSEPGRVPSPTFLVLKPTSKTAVFYRNRLCLLSGVWFLTACTGTPDPEAGKLPLGWQAGDPQAPSQISPQAALATAELLSTHPWRPFARNILHGDDPKGIRVDTPDVSYQENQRPGWWIPGEINRGIPYKWGGFDDLESFDKAVAAGLAAGDVSSAAKREADNSGVSSYAAGLDCSGFVSRCLGLPRGFDTAALPSVCDPIEAHRLRPGDLLNIPRSHVMLVAGWAKADRSWVYYYETGGLPDHWRPGLKASPLDALLALGFQPLRYHGMARETVPSGKEVLTRSIKSTAAIVPEPIIGEP